jgi:Cu-processing system permease protein
VKAILTVAHLTVHEAGRRKVLTSALICGLAFLLLFGIGFHFVVREISTEGPIDRMEARMIITFLTLAGLYATNFLTVMTSVLLPVDTLSGEISSGTIQTIASKPIRRSDIVLGKWLAFVGLAGAYLLLLAGGLLLIVRLRSGFSPPNVAIGLPLMFLESILLVTLSIAGGTRFSTVTNGIMAFGLYGLAFLGGWIEQIGTFNNNETARNIGTIASLIMPSESLWHLASNNMQPAILKQLPLTPFSASVPSGAMVVWAAGYIGVVLAVALRGFGKRDL